MDKITKNHSTENHQVENHKVKILGRQIGRTITAGELDLVSGGLRGTDDHVGTCTNEADCD